MRLALSVWEEDAVVMVLVADGLDRSCLSLEAGLDPWKAVEQP